MQPASTVGNESQKNILRKQYSAYAFRLDTFREDYFCRECNIVAEFQDGILTCPRCGVADVHTIELRGEL